MRYEGSGRPRRHLFRLCYAALLWCLALAPAALADASSAPAGSALGMAGAHAEAGRGPLAEVRLREQVVFVFRTGHGAQSAQARASTASAALTAAAKLEQTEVRIVPSGAAAVLYVGESPIAQLYEDDAHAAGDTSLEVHAAGIAAKVRQALQAERTRTLVADTVFAISLVIFLGLVTLFILRKSGEVARRVRMQLEERPERVTGLRVYSYQLLGPGSARLALLVLVNAGKWLLRGAVLYGYLVVVTTLFGPTRAFAERLTNWMVAPVSELVGRLAASLPVLVVVLFAIAVVWLLLRLTALFFESVAQGETESEWVRRDLAEALSVLVRIAIVVLALVFAAPIVTGQASGAFANVGSHLLLALALGSAPILASAGLGAVIVFRRHVRLGDQIEFGRANGTVEHFGLIDLLVVSNHGEPIRVPYFLALVSPLKITSGTAVHVTLMVDPNASQVEVLGTLRQCVAKISEEARVSLVELAGNGARYELSAPTSQGNTKERLLLEASEALRRAGIRLVGASADGERRP